MAVTFTVEDGTGLPNANSYVSVAEADDYLSVKPSITAWTNLTNTQKQNYLMWSTRLLDQRAVFKGTKANVDGALRWPRTGVTDRDGISVPYDAVPDQIKDATIEIAYYLLSAGLDPSVPAGGSGGGEIKRLKADVLEIEFVEGTATGSVAYFPLGLNDILGGLGSISNGSGAKFVGIKRA